METTSNGTNGRSSGEGPVMAALDRIERRLARLESTAALAETATRGVPAAFASLTDSFDDAARRAHEAGVDIDERLRAAVPVLERLTRPEVLAAVERLTERIDVLERGLALAEQAPALVAMATDTLDSAAERLRESGVDLDDRGKNLLRAAERLTSPRALDVLHALLDRVDVVHALLESGVFDPAPVAVVSCAGSALASTGREAPPPVGLWGALRALGDPNVQRAVGFAVRFAQLFGATISDGTCPPKQLPPNAAP